MKKLKILIVLLGILVFVISFIIGLKFFYMKYRKNKQLKIANEIINSNYQNEIEMITNEELELNKNIIGILEIPEIELIAPVKEGTSEKILKEAIGHFSESSYWNGNVALASHNRSRYVHYFENINKLQTGNEIIYKTKFGTRKYEVYESNIISETDWSVIENTGKNIITLITCIKNVPESRLCVRAREVL